jgi:hypothetical protein
MPWAYVDAISPALSGIMRTIETPISILAEGSVT